uniref:Secreted protein n=1 Tax=Cricetulus griseus TaxID=10029 RepID=A0A8C2QM16_CRIGR
MFVLPFFVLAWGLTGDLHHAFLGLDRELLRSEVVDVQGHAPAIGRLPDLRDSAAQLPVERTVEGGRGQGRGQGHRRGSLGGRGGQWAHVAGPTSGAEPLRPLIRQAGHPEGLVEEAAVGRVPVPEWFPAGAPQQREGHAALGHVLGQMIR